MASPVVLIRPIHDQGSRCLKRPYFFHQKPALRRVVRAEDKLSGGSRVQGHHVDFADQAALGPAY